MTLNLSFTFIHMCTLVKKILHMNYELWNTLNFQVPVGALHMQNTL